LLGWLAAGAVLCGPGPARALEFKVDGYDRLRYRWLRDESIRPVGKSAARSSETDFLDHRLLLNPTLKITDAVTIKAQLRIFDNVITDSTDSVTPFIVPSDPDTFRTPIDDVDREGEPIEDFQVERIWAEVMTPVGRFDFGRQSSQWGMGVLANAGNNLEWLWEGQGDDFGSTVDRIRFTTRLGEQGPYLVPIYDRIVERGNVGGLQLADNLDPTAATLGGIDTGSDDVHEFVVALYYPYGGAEDDFEAAGGVYLVYRTQDGSDGDAFIEDIYGKVRYKGLTLSTELVWVQAQATVVDRTPTTGGDIDIRAQQWAGVARLDLEGDLGGMDAGLRFEAGWASGPATDEFRAPIEGGNVALLGDKLDQFAFWSPDYDVDIILFDEILGRVSNATYLKGVAHLAPAKNWNSYVAVIWSRAFQPLTVVDRHDVRVSNFFNEDDPDAPDPEVGIPFRRFYSREGERDYGIEFDAGVSWQPLANLKMEIKGAVFLPGKVFNNTLTGATLSGPLGIDQPVKFRDGDPIYAISSQIAVMF
ncbi:MAG: hypothetical protein K8I02_06590, partial [Candidatus Methylomirabilis sp.]|nr:hypothetical protein [Deltaproteobacteria bacterium]